jgi:hypothetical protein
MLRKIVFAGAFLLAVFASPNPASADVVAEIELSTHLHAGAPRARLVLDDLSWLADALRDFLLR